MSKGARAALGWFACIALAFGGVTGFILLMKNTWSSWKDSDVLIRIVRVVGLAGLIVVACVGLTVKDKIAGD